MAGYDEHRMSNNAVQTYENGEIQNGLEMIAEIKDYFAEARKLVPEIGDEKLLSEGQKELIFYMNGNDGTEFDFVENGRVCEFMMFYKSTGMGFIKVYISREGIIYGFIYNEDTKLSQEPMMKLEPKSFSYSVVELAALLYTIADAKGLYDESLDRLDFGHKLTDEDCCCFGRLCIDMMFEEY